MPEQHWTILGSREIADHRIFRIRYDRYRFESAAREHDFVIVDCGDWVNVVPVTDDGQVVLIRQYRHGIKRATLEIPGGMIDHGEEPEAAAVRELEEETGYVPRSVRSLGRVHPNPAIQGNYCHLYLAEGCRPEAATRFDAFESIEVVPCPLADIPDMIRREDISNSMVINAFALMGVLGGAGPARS
ncbi:MAG: NUDIX hydrolase [Planctomycetota bacterium]